MHLKIVKKTIVFPICLALTLALSIISGCSDKQVQDISRARTELTLQIFDALERGDHQAALNKVTRLRKLDPNDLFLSKLAMVERNNLTIAQAQKHLDAGNIDMAIKLVNDSMTKHGKNEQLEEVQKDLQALKRMQLLIASLKDPVTSAQMRADAAALATLAETRPLAKPFAPFVKIKIEEAKQLSRWEEKQAEFGLESSLDLLIMEEKKERTAVLAELAIEDPDSPVVKAYLHAIETSADRIPPVFPSPDNPNEHVINQK